jgi:hypothetical protein
MLRRKFAGRMGWESDALGYGCGIGGTFSLRVQRLVESGVYLLDGVGLMDLRP